MRFQENWQKVVAQKQSLLCVGIDPAEKEQRTSLSIPSPLSKEEWTLSLIEQVSPYAAAIKLNRNYFKDAGRASLQRINKRIHELGMLSIDDSKLADIGETNDAGLYHAEMEGFDAVTYAPFPGNTIQAAEAAAKRKIGLIVLVLMSNPEYRVMKEAQIQGRSLYRYIAEQCAIAQVAGVVIGAPSPGNHLSQAEIHEVAGLLPNATVLVPGLGAQGGELEPITKVFGLRTIANVGRAIIYAESPGLEAKRYRDLIWQQVRSPIPS